MGFRQNIRDAVTRAVFSSQVEAIEHSLRVMENAYRRGPYQLSEADLIQALGEADSYLIDYVMRQRNYQLLSSVVTEFTEDDRLRAVDEARHMYHYDVQSFHAVNMWTDFGFGQRIEIVPRDDKLAEIWDEFWTARRNQPIIGQRKIHNLSTSVLNDGEVFLLFFGSSVDGKTTIRRLSTKQIVDIIFEHDDPDIPLYYVRSVIGQKQIWYPDWRAHPKQLARVELPQNAVLVTDTVPSVVIDGKETKVTSAKVLHVAYNEMNGRGWPQFSRMYQWARIYKQFMGDRAAVSRAAALFYDEITHKGGSRAQDIIEARFGTTLDRNTYRDTNPPPAAGAALIYNEQMSVTRRPYATGAGDAMSDAQIFGGQISVGTGIPPHWRGQPQALANRATAREMARPWNEQLERYQLMWTSVSQDMVEIVGSNVGEFEDYTADISLQSPIDVDVEDISTGMDSITSASTANAIDEELAITANNQLAEKMLVALGVPKAFEDEEEEPEEPGPPEEPDAEETLLQSLAEDLKAGEISEDDAMALLREEGLIVD